MDYTKNKMVSAKFTAKITSLPRNFVIFAGKFSTELTVKLRKFRFDHEIYREIIQIQFMLSQSRKNLRGTKKISERVQPGINNVCREVHCANPLQPSENLAGLIKRITQ